MGYRNIKQQKMYQPRKNKISLKKIAKFLKTNYTGKDFDNVLNFDKFTSEDIVGYSDVVSIKIVG